MHIKTFWVKALFDQIGKEHTQKELPHRFNDFLNTKADFFFLNLVFLIEKWGTASENSCLSQSQQPSLWGGFLAYHGLPYFKRPGSANAAVRANKMMIISAQSESIGEEDELQICRISHVTLVTRLAPAAQKTCEGQLWTALYFIFRIQL